MGTSCKKVPEQKCHYEPTYDVKEVPYYKPAQKPNRECQVDVAYKVQAYKDSYKKECHYIEVPKCKTVKKPVYSEEKEQVCHTEYRKECKPSYGYGETCENIPEEKCEYVTKTEYKSVPEEKCTEIDVPICKNIPEE